MRFWEASAVVPLVYDEPGSGAYRRLLRADPVMVVWVFTRTEVASALCRRAREGKIDPQAHRRAEDRLRKLAPHWTEIDAVLPVREQAERLLRIHALRAADALQLAAALVAFDLNPRRRPFVVADDVLATAAEREGFEAITPRS